LITAKFQSNKITLMKVIFLMPIISLLLMLSGGATVTLQNFSGYVYNSTSGLVATNTLWVLVVDADNNNSILGTSLDSTLSSLTGNSLFTANTTSINIGTNIGGDIVFAMGGFNGTGGTLGTNFSALSLTLGTNGTAAGLDYAFVWFPGVTYSGGAPITSGSNSHVIGTQVGSINRTTADGGTGFNGGMILPADGNTVTLGASSSAFGGTVSQAQFSAINLVPEPSSFMLTVLGVFGFILRRRR
jgi:hypothetical protein